MINLLPTQEKDTIKYARYNSQLRRWVVGTLVGLIGVVLVTLGSQFILRQNTHDYELAVASNKASLKQQDQKNTLEKVKNIQDNFKLAIDVLSREVLFSKLLPRVGQVMPSGTVLENLSLNTENDQTAVDLSASAKDFISGSQIQVNLIDPNNKLFKKADLVDVVCNNDKKEPSEYPCKVTMRVLPSDSGEFLLLDNGSKNK